MLNEFLENKSSASFDANKQVHMIRHDFSFTEQAMIQYTRASKTRQDILFVPQKKGFTILGTKYDMEIYVEHGMSQTIVPFCHDIFFKCQSSICF